MMKSTIRKDEYEQIYRLLDAVSPLPYDCGTLCGAVCCGTEDLRWKENPEFPSAQGSKDERTKESEAEHLKGELPWQNPVLQENTPPGNGPEEPEMGIYLLPGEEKLHSRQDSWLSWSEERAEDFAFPESWTGKVYFVRCKTPPECPRDKRPIQCRTFPLLPHFMEDGHLVMILNDLELPYHCPLIEKDMELEPDFLEVTWRCWARLVEDPLIHDLVRMDSEERYEEGGELVLVYDPRGLEQYEEQ